MTSPAGAISNASYRGGTWQPQGYPQAQQAYRYSAPLTAQPAFAYTQHTPTTVSQDNKKLENYRTQFEQRVHAFYMQRID